eukprot:706547-Lingulodinium_polyedra.AAC.1
MELIMARAVGLASYPHPNQVLAEQGWKVYDYSKKHTTVRSSKKFEEMHAQATKDLQSQKGWDETSEGLEKT